MKILPLRFVKAHRLNSHGDTMGAAYRGQCPFCERNLCIWPNEYERREIRTDTGNVCKHFDGFAKGGAAIMRPKMSVVRHGNVVRVNGTVLNRSMTQLIGDIEALYEDYHDRGWIQWPDWCPKRRFDALRKEAWRVYGPNGDKWKAQHAARVEENERAELARLKAKYERAQR